MIVYNAEPKDYSEKARDAWERNGYTYHEGSWAEVEDTPNFEGVSTLIVRLQRRVTDEVLARFPDLKRLISATTGHDHIDLGALQKRGVELISLRGHDEFLKTIPSTSEHSLALILALVRNIPRANEHVRAGSWNRDLFRGYQLKDKTLALVGYGRTGQKLAQYARAFDMKIRYYDPNVSLHPESKTDSLETLFSVADFLSFHVHLTKNTEKMLNSTNIDKIKSGAYLINTSRGKIFDEAAVVGSLPVNKIFGVAVDVLADELDDVKNSPLWKAQQAGLNVVITPHLGGATFDALWACEEYLVDDIFARDN